MAFLLYAFLSALAPIIDCRTGNAPVGIRLNCMGWIRLIALAEVKLFKCGSWNKHAKTEC